MIETERLILRGWREDDRAPWRAMNADPDVMAHFPAMLTNAEADFLMDRHRDLIAATGIGFWAVERRSDAAFLGFVGLNNVGTAGPMFGRWEIGWRLARAFWGHGYASEAAAAALAYGLDALGLERIVSYTASTNAASEAVMRRIGLERRPELDFDHPSLPNGHRLQRHIVYETH